MTALQYQILALVVDPAQPGIGRESGPGPGLGLPGWVGLIMGLASAALIIYARIRQRRTGQRVGLRKLSGGAAVGNAFMDLNSMLQADRPAAVEIQRLEEEDEQDEYGDGRRTDPPIRVVPGSPHRTDPSPGADDP